MSPDEAGRLRERVVSVRRRPLDRVPLLGQYVEEVWVILIGPTAVLLVRRLARLERAFPDGLDVDIEEMAAGMGVGRGRLVAALDRLITAGLIERGEVGVGVSGFAPILGPGQLSGAPAATVAAHDFLRRNVEP